MKTHPCYKGLNRKIYIIGVPLRQLLSEGAFCVLSIFVFQYNVFLTIGIAVIFHIICAGLYKKDDFWFRHLLFRMTIPEKRLYKKNISYVSSKRHNTEE